MGPPPPPQPNENPASAPETSPNALCVAERIKGKYSYARGRTYPTGCMIASRPGCMIPGSIFREALQPPRVIAISVPVVVAIGVSSCAATAPARASRRCGVAYCEAGGEVLDEG